MTALLVGALIATGVLLWSGRSDGRLRRLLNGQGTRQYDTGGRGSDVYGTSAPQPRAVDDLLAFDLDLVAICLTSGLPIPVALTLTAEATEDRSGLGRIARSMTIGGQDLSEDDRLAPVLEVFEFSEHTGVGPAPLIESVAQELRDSSRRRRQEAAAALGVKLVVPLGVCILPAFLLLSVVPVVISLLSDLTTVFF
ncbi:MAG: type II secretion system F family protein [Brevibacterium sp.]|nr:type II secretion system F family protein [Brevibacterium sp.]MDN5832910.1 type II secretion system F family protein [Brevibacterium sp.]MDN5876067.1 type II secretion system F family protein [Brevibacterium sp.]MDN5908885.1 type II secretion system F family protein [Brevibacterium sp.]MDN6123692.1 type II secretion system F family protein [Brevibacterium sp.]